ncbi:MAG: formate acetyltransferase [Gemmatimonadetes bacterium]|nr:formate acetyltransferase [Gemmatimonadota bacterium]MBT6149606.1 formate acetyltransferase [Gemmatimonadota bacterium]MBT7862808.1 formate acetyltransferase [Gemmatimonadota bacterium]
MTDILQPPRDVTPTPDAAPPYSFDARIASLRATKMAQTRLKQEVIGAMDYDDWPMVLPPEDRRELVQSISGSGMPINDVLLTGVDIQSNHENGSFYGPELCGANFRRLLEAHPPYVDPMSSLACAYMTNFGSYRSNGWDPKYAVPEDLTQVRERYQLVGAIGAGQHFCQDLAIGLELGFGGLQKKIDHYRTVNTAPDQQAFYEGLTQAILGMQHWIGAGAKHAAELASTESHPPLRQNLEQIALINERLVTEAPMTLREACQWILWYQSATRMYNGSGSLGALDQLLKPYYEREIADGTITDEEAIFHIACLLVRDTAYIQLGGPDAQGNDQTHAVSFLVMEAAHRLKVPANVAICVGDTTDPQLLTRGVEILLEDRQGMPKFLGIDRTVEGFQRNGIGVEDSRARVYAGCHWSGIPGREYTLNDCVKISFGNVFDVALRDMMASDDEPSVARLWGYFDQHMEIAVKGTADSIDFHMLHMKNVFPELMLDLLCVGPIEKGVDASDGYAGGVEFYNMCVDGCALATVADSFAAIEEHVESAGRLSWSELLQHLDADWAGAEGERMRLLMRRTTRYGAGGSRADNWAVLISEVFTRAVKAGSTAAGFNMIPGIFSWANTLPLGKALGATPNGRHAGDAISHGANPDPGFRKDGAPTAMAVAIASVQPGYGNSAPMQMELDPAAATGDQARIQVENLIRTHFDLGGTQINLNVLDRAKVLEAHEDPSKYPDLVVRVTGFSAYFASLSPEFRQLVVDRILCES